MTLRVRGLADIRIEVSRCIDTLRSLLVLKFQRLGAEYEDRLQAATPEAIDRYLQRLLTADSLAAVFAD